MLERSQLDDKTKFNSMMYDVECEERNVEAILSLIVQLYYKIYIHHECRQIMEKKKIEVTLSKNSLRKTLHSKKSDTSN